MSTLSFHLTLDKNISQYVAFPSLSTESQYLLLKKMGAGTDLWVNSLTSLHPHYAALSIHLSLSLSHLKSCLSPLYIFFSTGMSILLRNLCYCLSVLHCLKLEVFWRCWGVAWVWAHRSAWGCQYFWDTVGGLYKGELLHHVPFMVSDMRAPWHMLSPNFTHTLSQKILVGAKAKTGSMTAIK